MENGNKKNTKESKNNENEAAGYSSTPTGFTWHHVEDGRTMLLVPSDLHGAVRHTGGASLIRKGIRP